MPSSVLFRNLGLFVRDNFFSPSLCSELLSKMRFAESERALVVQPEGQGEILDEDIRKVLTVKMDPSMMKMVWDAIWELKPTLEDHFHVHLRASETPAFLRYGSGAFYRPHKDGHSDSPPSTKDRRVSVVIFLNGRSEEPSASTYTGGDLTFYGLLDGPKWEKCPLALNADAGLLVAFRSEMLHEVRPVISGQRFTIVSWFQK